jgi:hypothetical protein
VGVGGGGSGDGLLPGSGWVIGICEQCIHTTGGSSPSLLGAIGLLDVGSICVCRGLESSKEVAHDGGGGADCFPLDTSGVETCHSVREGCLEI